MQATRDEQQATIADLQRQLADLRKGKGFSGLSDYQAFAIASAAVERLEEPAAADASAKELSEKAEQLKALQQRTSKLSDKLKARAVQQRAVESTR